MGACAAGGAGGGVGRKRVRAAVVRRSARRLSAHAAADSTVGVPARLLHGGNDRARAVPCGQVVAVRLRPAPGCGTKRAGKLLRGECRVHRRASEADLCGKPQLLRAECGSRQASRRRAWAEDRRARSRCSKGTPLARAGHLGRAGQSRAPIRTGAVHARACRRRGEDRLCGPAGERRTRAHERDPDCGGLRAAASREAGCRCRPVRHPGAVDSARCHRRASARCAPRKRCWTRNAPSTSRPWRWWRRSIRTSARSASTTALTTR